MSTILDQQIPEIPESKKLVLMMETEPISAPSKRSRDAEAQDYDLLPFEDFLHTGDSELAFKDDNKVLKCPVYDQKGERIGRRLHPSGKPKFQQKNSIFEVLFF